MGGRASAVEGSATAPAAIGPLLARLRVARGLSQLRLAQRLCETAGMPTVSRHEVSRWERGERVPGTFWRGWLAAVLDVPLEQLEAAAAAARTGGLDGPGPAGWSGHQLWRPPTAPELLAALTRAGTHDLRDLAHAWLVGGPEPEPVGALVPVVPAVTAALDRRADRLAELRRMDDLVGGVDLGALVHRELRETVELLPAAAGREQQQRALLLVAGYAQLAGWVSADAGDPAAARRAYRVALRAAAAGGDRPFAGYALAALSHLTLEGGDPREALLLARTAHAGARQQASPRVEALLLQRLALAAAHAGERRTAHRALGAAQRAAPHTGTAAEPPWLYWLDRAELAAMTGRCLVALGRPLRALRQLPDPRPGLGPRAAALYGCCLARAYLQLGEYEHASRLAHRAVRHTVAAGSARAAALVRRLHPMLLRHRDLPAVRGYERRAATGIGYLPRPAPPSAAQPCHRVSSPG